MKGSRDNSDLKLRATITPLDRYLSFTSRKFREDLCRDDGLLLAHSYSVLFVWLFECDKFINFHQASAAGREYTRHEKAVCTKGNF